jgi:predicted CoA-binding protein
VILQTPSQRRALLDRSRTVYIVGASANHVRPSYFIYRYLSTHGFEVYPVNPKYPDIDGDRCYPTLAACASEHGPPDIVDVFRRAEEVVEIARDAIAVRAKAIWFQYGIINMEAIRLADEAGLDVVYDRCMKVEHARFAGGLTTAGMNSGIITSKRRSTP